MFQNLLWGGSWDMMQSWSCSANKFHFKHWPCVLLGNISVILQHLVSLSCRTSHLHLSTFFHFSFGIFNTHSAGQDTLNSPGAPDGWSWPGFGWGVTSYLLSCNPLLTFSSSLCHPLGVCGEHRPGHLLGHVLSGESPWGSGGHPPGDLRRPEPQRSRVQQRKRCNAQQRTAGEASLYGYVSHLHSLNCILSSARRYYTLVKYV